MNFKTFNFLFIALALALALGAPAALAHHSQYEREACIKATDVEPSWLGGTTLRLTWMIHLRSRCAPIREARTRVVIHQQ